MNTSNTSTAATVGTSSIGSGVAFRPVNQELADLARSLSHSTHLGLAPGARMLCAPAFIEALAELEDVLDERAIVLIDGPPGAGKTLLEHLLMARATQLGAQPVRVQAGRRPSGKQLSASIFAALQPGERAPKTQNRTEDQLKRLLAAPTQALVIYDEAQNLGVRGIEDIRYYWDETPQHFPLVFSGVEVERLLEGHSQLDDRIIFRYRLRLLDTSDSLAFAAGFHPLLTHLAANDPGLLAEIDLCGVRGTPRRWSSFTKHASRLLARIGAATITDEVAYVALEKFVRKRDLTSWTRRRP